MNMRVTGLILGLLAVGYLLFANNIGDDRTLLGTLLWGKPILEITEMK